MAAPTTRGTRHRIIRKAMLDYHAGRISLPAMLRCIAAIRPKR